MELSSRSAWLYSIYWRLATREDTRHEKKENAMKVGDLVRIAGDSHKLVGTVVELDPPSKSRMRLAMVLFPGSGVDGYPESWLEVVSESR